MDLKLDLGFLYAILDLFTPENANIVTSEQEVRRLPSGSLSPARDLVLIYKSIRPRPQPVGGAL